MDCLSWLVIFIVVFVIVFAVTGGAIVKRDGVGNSNTRVVGTPVNYKNDCNDPDSWINPK